MNHGGAWCLLNKMETRGYLVKHLMIRIGSPGKAFEFLLSSCSSFTRLFFFAPRFPSLFSFSHRHHSLFFYNYSIYLHIYSFFFDLFSFG
jgi:hypothetical protein